MGQTYTHLVWLWVVSIAGEGWLCHKHTRGMNGEYLGNSPKSYRLSTPGTTGSLLELTWLRDMHQTLEWEHIQASEGTRDHDHLILIEHLE